MDENFRDHGETMFGESTGRDVLQKSVEGVHTILADLRVSVEQLIAENELVAARGTMRCRQVGPFLGVPPTGRELVWKGLAIFRVVNGKIVERWFNSDSITIFRGLGIAPPPSANLPPL
jgi:predicted ester cyclase